MSEFLNRLRDAIVHFNGNQDLAAPSPSATKEFVCYLSNEDYQKMEREIIELPYLSTSTCTFGAVPLDTAIKSNFQSISIYGVTVHFHYMVGDHSFIGPVISLE